MILTERVEIDVRERIAVGNATTPRPRDGRELRTGKVERSVLISLVGVMWPGARTIEKITPVLLFLFLLLSERHASSLFRSVCGCVFTAFVYCPLCVFLLLFYYCFFGCFNFLFK